MPYFPPAGSGETQTGTTGATNTTYGQSTPSPSGADNTLIGAGAGNTGTTITTGADNTLIGYQAQVNSASASNRIAIGSGATCITNNTCKIGNSSLTALTFDGTSQKSVQIERPASGAGQILNIIPGASVSGGTDTAGGDLILQTGQGTGNSIPATVKIQGRGIGTTSGTTPQSPIAYRTIFGGAKILTNNTNTTILSANLASNSVAAGTLRYAVEVFDGTDLQVEEGHISYHLTNKAGTIANNTVIKFGNQQAATAGTLTVTWTISAASPALLQINANSSLTPSTGYPRVTYTVDNLTNQALV